MADVVWKDRKRIIFGLPWTFTRYSLTQDKLVIDTGFISRKEDEIRLYRILDISLDRPLSQRIWGLGTIRLNTADKTSPEIAIKRIKHAKDVKEMLSDMVEKERDEKRIAAREFMGYGDMDENVDGVN
jgi:uncharacterized membrane protein YdbT with pleckstrin-like domain